MYSRRLQATAVDTTVSFDLLNAAYVNQTMFQIDPTIMSFASSVGSVSVSVSGYGSGSGYGPAPTSIRNANAGAIVGGILGALCVVGIATYYGLVYVRSRRARRTLSSLTKIQAHINPIVSLNNNKISYSPAVVKISRSNSV